MPDPTELSIVIPVLDEAGQLADCLENLCTRRWVRERAEVIVCDGGSVDGSADIARRFPCRVVTGTPGRAAQMNQGAGVARGRRLLFLHVDSRLPSRFEGQFPHQAEWGFFRVRLDGAAFAYRVIESSINLRTRLTRVAGGDQGLYFSRAFFERIQGFPAIPLMEDIAICKHARRHSPPSILGDALTSSSRRWQQNGVIRTVLLMWTLRFAYWLGIDPRRLHRIYYPQRG